MDESYLTFDHECMFIRHNQPTSGRRSLIFVHGLGDSGLSFEDVFRDRRFDRFNLIVPDLIGYGRSSGAKQKERYRFRAHVERLWKVIEEFGLEEVIPVGHSMGGDLMTLFCQSDEKGVVKKLINIEGDLTEHDLFISTQAVHAHEQDRFEEWFYGDFIQKTILKKYIRYRSARLYFASLHFCRPEAFLENAIEVVRRNTQLDSEYKSETGEIYSGLTVPRIFCYGSTSLSKKTLAFLSEKNLEATEFRGAGHSPMVDRSEAFYDFLFDYVA